MLSRSPIGVSIHGHVTILEYRSLEDYQQNKVSAVLLSKRNAVHRENASLLIARTFAHREFDTIYTMAFGDGGATIDPLGNVVFNPPNVVGVADLYNPTYSEVVDDIAGAPPDNSMRYTHVAGTVISTCYIYCVLGKNEPQDNPLFTFNEIGLKTADDLLVTHVTFTPVTKQADVIVQVVYILKIVVEGPASISILSPSVPLIGVEASSELGSISVTGQLNPSLSLIGVEAGSELGSISVTNVEENNFTAGAVSFDGQTSLWQMPAMVDSSVGSMSMWLYVDEQQLVDTFGVRFTGGSFGDPDLDYVNGNISTLPASADTFLMAGWIGNADTTPGHNFMVLFAQNSPGTEFVISIGDGTTIPNGSFAWVITLYDGTGVQILDGYTTIPVDLTDGWHSFAISGQMSTQTIQFMVDRTLYPATNFTWYSTNEISGIGAVLNGEWEVGGTQGGNPISQPNVPPAYTYAPLAGNLAPWGPDIDLSDFRFGMGEPFYDLTDTFTVDALFTPNNWQESWGSQAELITGYVPAIFLYGSASEYLTNYGGGWTISSQGPGLTDVTGPLRSSRYSTTGDLFNENQGYLMIDPGFGQTFFISVGETKTNYTPAITITDISRAVHAVVTLSQPHNIQVGTNLLVLSISQDGWGISNTSAIEVLSVTSNTVTLDVATDSIPDPYDPLLNPSAMLQVLNSMQFYFGGSTGQTFAVEHLYALPAGQWVNVLAAWDTNRTAGAKTLLLYFGDSQIAASNIFDPNPAFDVYWSYDFDNDRPPEMDVAWWVIGRNTFCYMSELWFAPGQYIDFTDPDNRARFHDGSNKPVSLGTDGSLPTGSVPVMYQHIDPVPPDPYTLLNLPVRAVRVLSTSRVTGSPGWSPSRTLTCSFWVYSAYDGYIFYQSSNASNIYFHYPNLTVQLYDASFNSFIFHIPANSDPLYPGRLPFGRLVNYRFAVDLNHTIGNKIVYAYVDGDSVTVTVDVDNANNLLVDWDDGLTEAMSGSGQGGCLGTVWIAPGQFFDPGPFFYSGGLPTDIGADGSTPSGTAPLMYFNISGSQPASDFFINLGSGGDFMDGSGTLLPSGTQFLDNQATGGSNKLQVNINNFEFPLAPTNPSE